MHGFKPVTSVQKIVNKIVDLILENVGGNTQCDAMLFVGLYTGWKNQIEMFWTGISNKI